MSDYGDISIIVRECGERTADACVGLLERIFPGHAIIRVSSRPFAATLQESLVQGLAAGRPWTLCIDADVLALPALRQFVDEARHLPPHFVEAQGLVADKLLPACRPAGNHLYRTALIPKMLALFDSAAGLRPESSLLETMGKAGHPYHQSARLIGLHDFGQFAEDIHDKAALHGHKHAYLGEELLPLWERWASEDDDYRIALQAFRAAAGSDVPHQVSRRSPGTAPVASPGRSPVPMALPTDEQLMQWLAGAPHRRPEAATLRMRIDNDIRNVMSFQKQHYERTLTFWQKWWRRVGNRYPYLDLPA